MNDIEEIPVETVAGERPRSAIGERLLIGLAGVALLGGILIAGSNFLAGLGLTAADPSPSATTEETEQPDRTVRPTASPRPLRELTLVPGEPPRPVEAFYPMTSWLEALAPIEVWSAPNGRAVVDELETGAIVVVDPADPAMDATDWYVIQSAGVAGEAGWVHVDGRSARVTPVAMGTYSGGALGLAAGPSGFVARTWAPARAPDDPEPRTLTSPDGEHWSLATQDSPAGIGAWTAAWGPSGWLAATSLDGDPTTATWIWESSEGGRWTPVGRLPIPGDARVQRLVASDDGYVLSLTRMDGPGTQMIWSSPDGITWRESEDIRIVAGVGDYFGSSGLRLLPVPGGYLAWAWTDAAYGSPEVAWSADARTWQTIPIGTEPVAMLDIVAVGDVLLAVAAGTDGRVMTWRGSLGDELPRQLPTPYLALAFDGAVVTSLVSDGDRAYAFGYRREDGEALAWVSDGISWSRLATPEGGFGGIPREAAAGPAGVVVAGARINDLGQSPVFWHLRPDGSWVREPDPAVPLLPAPACPPRPERALDFVTLEPSTAVACFGAEPFTFVAWSAVCEGCWGDDPGPRRPRSADWLRYGEPPYLLLLPMEGDGNTGWWRQAILDPNLEWSEEMAGTWLRVTGHFDDPAAQLCGIRGPDEGAGAWWSGPEADSLYCRWAFVVTGAEAVPRPA